MSDFKAQMRQIRFRLGFKGVYFCVNCEEREEKGIEGRGGKDGVEKEGRKEEKDGMGSNEREGIVEFHHPLLSNLTTGLWSKTPGAKWARRTLNVLIHHAIQNYTINYTIIQLASFSIERR